MSGLIFWKIEHGDPLILFHLLKGKLHSKIISSDMKDFFRRIQWWRSEVEIRTGRRSNRRSKMAEKSQVTPPRGRHESLVPGVSSSRLRPDSDQSRIWCRARPWLVCDSLNELTWVSFVVHCWHLTIFFFFFLSFRECCLTRQWQSTECDTRYMVQRKKFDVILRFLVDRYQRTKPPKPDASQFVVPARRPKPVIGSGGLSSSRFDDDVPEVNCIWTASFSWRVKEAALWFESYGSKNLTGGTTWSSQSTSTDWREHTIGAVDDRNLPTEEAYKYQKVTKISCDIGSRFEASWLDCVTMMSEMTIAVIVVSASCHHLTRADSGWSRISWFSRVILPWLRGGTSVAPWRHKCSHVPVFPPSVWPSSRSNFDLGPSPSDSTEKNSIVSELMILECSFPLMLVL